MSKKVVILAAAALASITMLFNTGPARADVSTVIDSSHDIRHRAYMIPNPAYIDELTTPGVPTTIAAPNLNQQVCAYCHTPHYSDSAAGLPLWNRLAPVTGFTMYGTTVRGTTPDGTPNPYSLGCLSCHDGATAYDAVIKKPLAVVGATGSPGAEIMKPGTMNSTTRSRAVGKDGDLTNDHPISIAYDPANGLNTVTVAGSFVSQVSDMRLYNDKVECASCHDVHDQDTYGQFLRASMDLSGLCLQCHK